MAQVDSALLNALRWRLIGPHRGGRVVAVAGDPVDPMTFYFGACSGGVWKTDDGGTYWRNVSDGFFNSAAVGAIAVADSDRNVVYVGMGEACIRENVYGGDGVYRSTDGGRTWTHLGLADTRHIARIRVHPKDPDTVYVAALGHAFGPNKERGVYRSRDGGKNWEQVLFRSEDAGAVDLSLDPNNPRIIFAAIYQARRYPWTMEGGGPDSSLYRSTDGGDTWTDISRNPGLPSGTLGRLGVAVSPARSSRVWAMVEAEDQGGVYRSDDGGATWQRTSDDAALQGRAWYYTHIFAHPQDPDTVWVLEGATHASTDGGRTFSGVPVPHGDCHDLWFDPRNPRRMIHGNDGGACVSFNGGVSWSTLDNQPTAQFYHVTTDTRHPYRVYGSQQDNTSITVPSRTATGSISIADWYSVGGGECGYIAIRPDDPDIIYAGNHSNGYVSRYNHRTGQVRNIMVWPEPIAGWGAKDMKYRFQWTFPIMLSPHDPQTLYVTGNIAFRSTDEGTSWEPISPDLTRNDVTKMEPSGGPVSKDVTNAEYYGTIFAFAESPVQPSLLWAGSDDGLVHVSQDNGETWENVTPTDLPEWALISIIEPSSHDPATAYVAATRIKLDDTSPYLYKTTDCGKTWQTIVAGLPADEFTRAIREDPARRGLLYAGTATGVYISFDDGDCWQPFQLNLPVVPVHDLLVKGSDLIAATHGRAFWVLDDITPLHQITDDMAGSAAHLFKPRATLRSASRARAGGRGTGTQYGMAGPVVVAYDQSPSGRTFLDAGENPADGALVRYYLREASPGAVSLTILDSGGAVVRTFGSASDAPKSGSREPVLPAKAGLNEFVWDLRRPGATRVPGDVTTELIFDSALLGPAVVPGTYQVQLRVGEETFAQSLEVLPDPRLDVTQEQLEAQHALLLSIRDKLSETHEGINRIRSLRQQVDEWARRGSGTAGAERIAEAASALKEHLAAIEGELTQVKARAQIDRLKYPVKLNGKLAGLAANVASADEQPTQQAHAVQGHLAGQVDSHLGRLQEVMDEELPLFTNLLEELEVPLVAPQAAP